MADLFTLAGTIAIKGVEQSEKEINKIVKQAESLTKKVTEFSISLVHNAIKNTDNIAKYAKQFNMSTTAVQELQHVLLKADLSVEQFSGALSGLSSKMKSANDGNKTAASLFESLGVSIADSNGELRNQGDVLWDTLEALQNVENQTERNAIANTLFGENGKKISELLNGEEGTIAELRQQSHDMNLILSEESVAAGDALVETWGSINESLTAAGTKIGAVLLPAMVDFLGFITDRSPDIIAGIDSIVKWGTENSGAIKVAFSAIAAGLIACAVAAHPFAAAITAITAGLLLLASASETAITPFSSYSEEEIAALQRYHDAWKNLNEAKEAYNATEDPFEKAGKHNEVQMAQASVDEATAALNMLPNASELFRTYNEWFAEQGNAGFSVDIPVGVNETSEGEMQTTIDGYDLEGMALLLADPLSETNLQSYLNGLNLTVPVTAKITGLNGIPGFAKGIDYVKEDNMLAYLHKGEAVLTASEAAVWRGENRLTDSTASRMRKASASSDQPITVNLTVNGVSSNPYEIAGEVRNALELLRWQG